MKIALIIIDSLRADHLGIYTIGIHSNPFFTIHPSFNKGFELLKDLKPNHNKIKAIRYILQDKPYAYERAHEGIEYSQHNKWVKKRKYFPLDAFNGYT